MRRGGHVQRELCRGECTCGGGASCELECDEPPCDVSCGSMASCTGDCSGGTCTCAANGACEFACEESCSVECQGDNPRCDATYTDGDVLCGANSTCDLTCTAPPCTARCQIGSSCILRCPDGTRAGDEGCDITQCVGDNPVLCPTRTVVVCNAPCPPGS